MRDTRKLYEKRSRRSDGKSGGRGGRDPQSDVKRWIALSVLSLGIFGAGFLMGRNLDSPDTEKFPARSVAAIDEDHVRHVMAKSEFHELLTEPVVEEAHQLDVVKPSRRTPDESAEDKRPTELPGDKDAKVTARLLLNKLLKKTEGMINRATKSDIQGEDVQVKRIEEDAASLDGQDDIYTVQVSSFQTEEEALSFAARLKRLDYSPYVLESDLGVRGVWYRVRIGNFTSKSQADDIHQRLTSNNIPGWILRTRM